MRYARRLVDGVRWISAIQRWTTAVALALGVGTVGWVLAVLLGITSVSHAPGQVVILFYEAVQERRFDDATEHLSVDAKAKLAALAPDDYDTLMRELSHDFTSSDLEPLGVQNFGQVAVAGVLQDQPPDRFDLRVEILVKEGRYWRIEWPLGNANWMEAIDRFDPTLRFRFSDE